MSKKFKLMLHPRSKLPVLAHADGTMVPGQVEVVVRNHCDDVPAVVITFSLMQIDIALHEIAKFS